MEKVKVLLYCNGLIAKRFYSSKLEVGDVTQIYDFKWKVYEVKDIFTRGVFVWQSAEVGTIFEEEITTKHKLRDDWELAPSIYDDLGPPR